jgi:hypothetical protein
MQAPSLRIIKAIVMLDSDGNRMIGKYYDDQFGSVKEQKVFERTLFAKTAKANSEIVMIDGMTVVYRSNVDLFFYVIGASSENELILVSVLNCFYESISQIMRKHVEKKYLLENMDSAILAVDEICDGGILLETDPSQIVQRVCFKADQDIPLGEQTVFDLFRSARDQLKTSGYR